MNGKESHVTLLKKWRNNSYANRSWTILTALITILKTSSIYVFSHIFTEYQEPGLESNTASHNRIKKHFDDDGNTGNDDVM